MVVSLIVVDSLLATLFSQIFNKSISDMGLGLFSLFAFLEFNLKYLPTQNIPW